MVDEEGLINTIDFPKNVRNLNENLPKPKYESNSGIVRKIQTEQKQGESESHLFRWQDLSLDPDEKALKKSADRALRVRYPIENDHNLIGHRRSSPINYNLHDLRVQYDHDSHLGDRENGRDHHDYGCDFEFRKRYYACSLRARRTTYRALKGNMQIPI